MSSPFWTWGGTRNGRLEPQYANAQGAVSLLYYGGTYYFTYGYVGAGYQYDSGYNFDYTAETDHVFVLGEDSGHFPDYRYASDGVSFVQQANIDMTSYDIIYFCWRLAQAARMPITPRRLTSDTIEVKNTGLAAYGDGALGVVLPKGFSAGFEDQDADRVAVLVGTDFNDGSYRVSVVPKDTDGLGGGAFPPGRVAAAPDSTRWIGPGDADPAPDPNPVRQYKNGQVAVLDMGTPTPEVKAGATVLIPGWRWIARAYVDTVLRTELYETRPGRSWQRNYMAAHVSQLTGVHSLKFELSLEAITS